MDWFKVCTKVSRAEVLNRELFEDFMVDEFHRLMIRQVSPSTALPTQGECVRFSVRAATLFFSTAVDPSAACKELTGTGSVWFAAALMRP